ncbi:MAG: dinitrogenase reductase activating glycohydrolase (draG) [Proteobacteria bacterium]|nr:dinitrogenase reductase activating glycohydrolase (draG) [Pseudomonadota bacterium]
MPLSANQLTSCLLGGAVGDSIGLPYEGLSTRRSRRMARLPLRHRFIFGHGMVSDDTDHSIFVAQSLIRSRGDATKFRSCLAWRLRFWLLCLPAGIGLATLRGIIKLWLGFSNSGVYSAGNGPAMRSAIIGAFFPEDAKARQTHVAASTLLTHTDPKALAGALAIAEVAAHLVSQRWLERPPLAEFIQTLQDISPDPDWNEAINSLQAALNAADPLAAAQKYFGSRNGISGYVLHSVPFALAAWYHHFGDYRSTIEAITQAGGDVDTVAAMAGSLAGISAEHSGIPTEWVDKLNDWPHSTKYLRSLAAGLADPAKPVCTSFSPWFFPRGIIFTVIVLAHGFRRLLPPY